MNPMRIIFNSGLQGVNESNAADLAKHLVKRSVSFSHAITRGGFHCVEFLYEADLRAASTHLQTTLPTGTFQVKGLPS